MSSKITKHSKLYLINTIYYIIFRKGDCILMNTSSGHLVRSKPHSSDEGGVAIGIAALDSPWLVSNEDYVMFIADRN